jgi:hypothetical protein
MKTLVWFGIAVLTILSCNKETNDLPISEFSADTGLIIKYGTYSGWCAGDDSLILSKNNLFYFKYSPCDINKNTIEYGLISPEDKEELVNALDFEEFNKIELNSCNVCVDGTDYWISVKDGLYNHKIRYGYGDSLSLTEIRLFIKL